MYSLIRAPDVPTKIRGGGNLNYSLSGHVLSPSRIICPRVRINTHVTEALEYPRIALLHVRLSRETNKCCLRV